MLVHRFVPESPIKTASRLDVPGAVLLSVGLVALLLALTEGEQLGLGLGAHRSGCSPSSAVALVAWVRRRARVDEPMVDMRCSPRARCCSRT